MLAIKANVAEKISDYTVIIRNDIDFTIGINGKPEVQVTVKI